VKFSEVIKAADFKAGVTIFAGTKRIPILKASLDTSGQIVRYALGMPVRSANRAVWAYEEAKGLIQNTEGQYLRSVFPKPIQDSPVERGEDSK
jgi:hypothetical protein